MVDLSKYIGNKIRYYRNNLGMTQEELGFKIGTGKSRISNYETGYRTPQQNDLFNLAEALQVSINDLFPPTSNQPPLFSVYNQLIQPRQEKVYQFAEHQLEQQQLEEDSELYIVGQTAAGEPLSYGDSNINKINTHIPKGADYALTVKGDSMEPLIKNGSIIFYKEQPTLENGEVGIIEVNRDEVTCKKFYQYDDKVVLKSINEKYEDITLKDVPVRVIGKVILNEKKEV